MRMIDLIVKKKNGLSLSKEEIEYMIKEYTNDNIPDYQMSAMMMAICFNDMTNKEATDLTMAMANSGDILDLSMIDGIKVDKHSSGGVGDKTSLALIPMVASCGAKVAKMSGRGLGHTGGTIDKLESFNGFNTQITNEEFINNVNKIGLSIMAQTKSLAPADKRLYALRDVTATVDNMALIASSIMSKKIASGADVIVLDVKTGSGAFMKTKDEAMELAKKMVDIGKLSNRKVMALVTNMDQPLGNMVGNALEVKEAIETLKGNGPSDFTTLCINLGAHMLVLGEVAKDYDEAVLMLKDSIKSGKALDKLAEFVKMQGGNEEDVYNPDRLPKASMSMELKASKEGYINKIICDEVGICSLILGGGRENKDSIIDLSVGIELKKKVSDKVKCGDVLAVIYGNDKDKMNTAIERLSKAYIIGDDEPIKQEIILGEVV